MKVGLCLYIHEKIQSQISLEYTAVKIASDNAFDPYLLFHRFLVVSKYGDTSLAVVLSYDLSSHPAAFFEAKNILCTADKPQMLRQFESML
ncbi:hypothetical protein DPMN_047740 [Dreissena polymorpha]|uniref:Uncharacterized protein n=1 Tax=Dreissena polymorpha TaxID=45954 RepID=A0A9D4I259_DREPO|nr:hypothetical protein DPMN_047740 [Dreissena polymorpha]